jgi:outer membrane cobalamin receptor
VRVALAAAFWLVGASLARADGDLPVPAAPPGAAASAGATATRYETVVVPVPETAPLPREDRVASGSVVLPADSPRAYDDLGSLLMEVPGVTTTRTGALGSLTLVSLRGSNPDQVRIFIDGVPLNIAEGGAIDLSTLPLGDVERVEVYRGQSPLVFGQSALGGIISITTRTPGTPALAARAGTGSFGAYFGDASGSGRVGRLRLYLGAHALRSLGDFPYPNDNGTPLNPADDGTSARTNNDVRQADGALRAAVDLPGRRTLSLGVLAFGRDQGLAGLHLAQTHFVRFQTARALASLRYESRDDLGEGGRLGAQVYASWVRDHYSDPGELSAGVWSTHDTTQALGAIANASRPVGTWLRLAAVTEGRVETFLPVNDADAMPVGVDAQRLVGVGGLEATLHWHAADLDVIPSARAEALRDVVTGRDPLLQTNRPADPPVSRVMPVLRLGLVRPLGERVALKANVGRYGRAPSFFELFAGMGRFIGNPALLPERGTNADVAVTVDLDVGGHLRLSSRTAAFGARVEDLIEWQHDLQGHARPDNIPGARIMGVEQELRAALGAWTRVVVQGTFLDAVDHSGSTAHDGRQLPRRPRWHAYARPELVRLPLPRAASIDVGAFVDGAVTAGAFDDPANLVPLPARLLVGAGLSVAHPRSGLRAVVSAQNLTDTATWDTSYWPIPGRTIYFALGWQSAPGNTNDQQTNQTTRSN